MSERRRYEINPSFADLFTTQEDRDEAKLEKVQMLPLKDLQPFPDHPFEVRDDEEMEKLVDSIRVHGVLMPAIARERPDGSYELVAGHRRKRACELAGLQEMPVLVREMDDDTATKAASSSSLSGGSYEPVLSAAFACLRRGWYCRDGIRCGN